MDLNFWQSGIYAMQFCSMKLGRNWANLVTHNTTWAHTSEDGLKPDNTLYETKGLCFSSCGRLIDAIGLLDDDLVSLLGVH